MNFFINKIFNKLFIFCVVLFFFSMYIEIRNFYNLFLKMSGKITTKRKTNTYSYNEKTVKTENKVIGEYFVNFNDFF